MSSVKTTIHLEFFHTTEGIVSSVQWIANFIGVIVMFSSDTHWYGGSDANFYEFTAMTGLIIGIILIIGQILKLIPNDNRLVLLILLGYDALFAFFNLIAACVIITYAKHWSEMGASIFFGYVAFLAFVADGFLKFIKIRNGGNGNDPQPDGQEGAWTTQSPPPKY